MGLFSFIKPSPLELQINNYNTKNNKISVFDIKIKSIFVATKILLNNNTIMKKLLLLALFIVQCLLVSSAKKIESFLGDEQTSEYFPHPER